MMVIRIMSRWRHWRIWLSVRVGLKPLSISNSIKDTKRAKFVSTGAKLTSAHPGLEVELPAGEQPICSRTWR